ncbi:hypothetical protein ACLB2K_019348 [Fragaria x ananassa]
MGGWNFIHFTSFILLYVLLRSETCMSSVQYIGKISPGFEGAQQNWIDYGGLFLLSNQSHFGFGFFPTPQDGTLFLLGVVHIDTSSVVWTANRGSPVSDVDKFVFDDKCSVSLQKSGSVVWSIDTGGRTVSSMELQDSGNMVLLGDDNGVVWQSFSHPTDTLLWIQEFPEGMKLQSEPSSNNGTYVLEIKSGDLILSAVLGSDGVISFSNLQNGASNGPSTTKIPSDSCSTPEPCDSYFECFSNKCQCPSGLSSRANCKSGIVTSCSKASTMLTSAGDGLYYFALEFISPSSRTDLEGCKSSCLANCSCVAVFYQNSTRNCYMFDRIGSFQNSDQGFVSYVKVLSDGSGGSVENRSVNGFALSNKNKTRARNGFARSEDLASLHAKWICAGILQSSSDSAPIPQNLPYSCSAHAAVSIDRLVLVNSSSEVAHGNPLSPDQEVKRTQSTFSLSARWHARNSPFLFVRY